MMKYKNILRVVVVLILIVGFPLVSWLYLKTGVKYRKEALAELQNHGKLPVFSLSTQDRDTLTNEMVKGKILVVDFFDSGKPETPALMHFLTALHHQFDDRTDVLFLNHAIHPGHDSLSGLRSYAEKQGVKDFNQCLFLSADSLTMADLANNQYHMPADHLYGDFALVDTAGVIRKYYDSGSPKDMKRLVEHIAMILPLAKTDSLVLRKDLEK